MFDTNTIKSFQDVETPFYYYDMGVLRQTLDACRDASAKYGFHVHYAMKANFNPRVIDTIQAYGFGADCVSGNEVKCAIEHGFDKGKVVFAGVGKSDKEINAALDADIFCFNVESVQELEIINDLAAAKGKVAGIAIRINPNVDAHTHHYITTGLDENKFGINTWQLNSVAETLRKCAHLQFLGIHFHIGSQITDMEVYRSLCLRINEMQDWFEDHGFAIKVLNTGGGLGVDYHNPDSNSIADFESYFNVFKKFLKVKPGQEVHFELGRALVAQSASLVSRVLYVKNGLKKNFLILDAGMTELMRPMLYQAYHAIENLSQNSKFKSQNLQDGYSENLSQNSKFKIQNLQDGYTESLSQNSKVKSQNLQDGYSENLSQNSKFKSQNLQDGYTESLSQNSKVKSQNLQGETLKYDVVGPICESTDCFRKDVDLPQSYRGDLIAIRTAGAYGEVMASQYNLRERVQSVYSN